MQYLCQVSENYNVAVSLCLPRLYGCLWLVIWLLNNQYNILWKNIFVRLIFIYGGWKHTYDKVSLVTDIWILEILFVIIRNCLRFQQKNLCISHLWLLRMFVPALLIYLIILFVLNHCYSRKSTIKYFF